MVTKHAIKKIEIKGDDWEYIVEGLGKTTFLILPGGGQTAQSNFQLIEEFKDKYKVIAITIFISDSLDSCCFAINEILKKENAEKEIIVYGLSLGGLIAQSYTLRNKEKVSALILSHACTPSSKTYKNKVITPLKFIRLILPLMNDPTIRFINNNLYMRVQGVSKNKVQPVLSEEIKEANKYHAKYFRDKFMSKKLIQTWINLHIDFFRNEIFNKDTFKDWNGKVLIIRTDNDPLMQDEGDFKRVYPNSRIITFSGTGHLSFYYKFNEIVQEIKQFLNLKT